MRLFDRFGNAVGDVVSPASEGGGLLFLAVIILFGELWLMYQILKLIFKFFVMTFKGFRAIFTGDSESIVQLAPFLILVVLSIDAYIIYLFVR